MKTFKMITMVSSQIAAIGHDKDTSTLRVQFVRGGVYDYAHVDEELFNRLLHSESIGKTFAQLIKGSAAHPFVKVEGVAS